MIATALLAAVTAAVAPLQSGVWSDVHIDRASGDYAGLEVTIKSAEAHAATVMVCGDGCGQATSVPIVRDATGFGFRTRSGSLDDVNEIMACHARFAGSALHVRCDRGREEALRHRARSYFAVAMHAGVWSDVQSSPRSGDFAGLVLRIPSQDAQSIGLIVCEGGCTPEFSAPIVRTDVGFTFDVAKPLQDRAGKPVALPPRHAVARVDGNVLVVLWLHEDTVDVLRRHGRPLRLPRDTPVLENQGPRA